MRKGPFLSAVATVCEIEEKTVRVFARELINAGYLSSGARGVNAPHMTHVDLAVMLIAMLGTTKPARAVEVVEHVGRMQLAVPEAWVSGPNLPESPNHTFQELMECACKPETKLPPGVTFEVEGSALAVVENKDIKTDEGETFSELYVPRQMLQRAVEGKIDPALSLNGLVHTGRIGARAIEAIKALVFEEETPPADHPASSCLEEG